MPEANMLLQEWVSYSINIEQGLIGVQNIRT